jgi:hypothetical protein
MGSLVDKLGFKILILIFFCSSCSSIQFKSSEIIPVTFDTNETETKDISVKVEKSFYLWGLIPNKEVIEVDKVFEEKGARQISSLSIKEVEKKEKGIWMFVTLGLYYPQTFELSAKITQ